MVPKQSSPHVSASNSSSTSIPEASFDEDLVILGKGLHADRSYLSGVQRIFVSEYI